MMNTPLKAIGLAKTLENCPKFLKMLDLTIEEQEENLRKLKIVRRAIKDELLGENKEGLARAMDEASPVGMSSLESDMQKALEAEISGQGEGLQ